MTTPAPITAASASTPVTGAGSYCTPTQFFQFFDLRTTADYLSDTGTPIGAIAFTNPVQIDPTVVAVNAAFLAILGAASGTLESAVQVGDRYTPGDLILLTTGPMIGSNQANLIARIVAGIGIPMLYERRPDVMMPEIAIVKKANDFLAAIADGMAIFGLQESMNAGRIESQIEQLQDVVDRNMPSWEARRLFGRRNKWRNTGPGMSGGANVDWNGW